MPICIKQKLGVICFWDIPPPILLLGMLFKLCIRDAKPKYQRNDSCFYAEVALRIGHEFFQLVLPPSGCSSGLMYTT